MQKVIYMHMMSHDVAGTSIIYYNSEVTAESKIIASISTNSFKCIMEPWLVQQRVRPYLTGMHISYFENSDQTFSADRIKMSSQINYLYRLKVTNHHQQSATA